MLLVVAGLIWFLLWFLVEIFDMFTTDSGLTIVMKSLGIGWLLAAGYGFSIMDQKSREESIDQ
jgi:hypothetical protein